MRAEGIKLGAREVVPCVVVQNAREMYLGTKTR